MNKYGKHTKLLWVVYCSTSFAGGGAYTLKFIQAMLELGWEVTLFTTYIDFRILEHKNLKIYTFNNRIFLITEIIKFLHNNKKKFIVLILADHLSLKLLFILKYIYKNIKLTYIIQCSYDYALKPLTNLYRRIAFNACDLIISVSKNIKSELERKQFKPETVCVYKSVDVKSVKKVDTFFPKANTVIHVARFATGKGHEDLLEASINQNWEVLFCGDGDLFTKIKKQANGRKDVSFLGWIKDMDSIYQRAAVCAFPSYSEGMPNVLLESMLHCIPIVAYDNTGARELITNGQTGLLVPTGDIIKLREGINELLLNFELRKKIINNGFDVINNVFSAKEMAEQCRSAFSKL